MPTRFVARLQRRHRSRPNEMILRILLVICHSFLVIIGFHSFPSFPPGECSHHYNCSQQVHLSLGAVTAFFLWRGEYHSAAL